MNLLSLFYMEKPVALDWILTPYYRLHSDEIYVEYLPKLEEGVVNSMRKYGEYGEGTTNLVWKRREIK